MDNELSLCDFCKQKKIVNRKYLKPSLYTKPKENYNKLYNEGDYFIIIRYCKDCGEPKS